MDFPEFDENLKELIYLGRETVDVEFKGALTWSKNSTNMFITRAMIAMANNRDGGVIVIGVKDDSFEPIGLTDTEINSFDYDTIGRFLNNYAQPAIDFTLRKGKVTQSDGSEKLFVIIQIQETTYLPVVSTKTVKWDPTAPEVSSNLALRDGVVYVRSKSPVESRELKGHREWVDFLNLLMDRRQDELIAKIPWGVFKPEIQRNNDPDQFTQQLNGL